MRPVIVSVVIVLSLIYFLTGGLKNEPKSSLEEVPTNDEAQLPWEYTDRATILMMEDRFEVVKNMLHNYRESHRVSSYYKVDTTIGRGISRHYRIGFDDFITLNCNYIRYIRYDIDFSDNELIESWHLELDSFCFGFQHPSKNEIEYRCHLSYKYFVGADSSSFTFVANDTTYDYEYSEIKDLTKQELFFLLKKCDIIPFSDPAKWFPKNKGRYLQKEFQDSVLDKHKLLMPTRYIHGQ